MAHKTYQFEVTYENDNSRKGTVTCRIAAETAVNQAEVPLFRNVCSLFCCRAAVQDAKGSSVVEAVIPGLHTVSYI